MSAPTPPRHRAPTPGQFFDTPYEYRCLCVGPPDHTGSFNAVDSCGELAQFSVDMVTRIHRS